MGIDFESTGLDVKTERITEIGAALWDAITNRPLITVGLFLYDPATYAPLNAEVIRITGITDEMLKEFGTDPTKNLNWLDLFCKQHRVDFLVGHNSTHFDRPLLYAELDRLGVAAPTLRTLPWLDTMTDIPFVPEPDSRKLKYLAADHGFLNPFAHRAVFDILTTFQVLANYDIQDVIEYSKVPFVVVRAVVSFDDKQLAKDRKFSWEKIGDKTYSKCWVKRIKENQLDQLIKDCPFKVVQLKE